MNDGVSDNGKTKTLQRAALGVVAVAALGAAGFFGFNFYRGYASLRACDLAAASEFELESHAGAGVPGGMIEPGRAIPACREAVRRNPESARAAYQLYRALIANGYTEGAQRAHDDSERLGHVEARLAAPLEQPEGDGDAQRQPLSANAAPALQNVVAQADAGNPRAMMLASRIIVNLTGVEDPNTQQTLLQIFAPLDLERAVRRAVAGEFGQAALESLPDESDMFGRSLTALQYQLLYDAAGRDFLPALAETDAAAAAQRGYIPARMTTAELAYAAEQQAGRNTIETYMSALAALAEEGYRPAMLRLAMLQLGTQGATPNYAEAQRWLDRIAPVVVSEEPQ